MSSYIALFYKTELNLYRLHEQSINEELCQYFNTLDNFFKCIYIETSMFNDKNKQCAWDQTILGELESYKVALSAVCFENEVLHLLRLCPHPTT